MGKLRGIFVSAVTPFTADEEVDTEAAKALYDYLIGAGVHGIVILGDTGEFSSLTPDERMRYVDVALQYVDNRVPAIVHVSATTAREAVIYAQHAQNAGADALMVLPPYYKNSIPSEDEIYFHYETIAEAVDLPIMAYASDITGREVMTPKFISRLADIDNFQYVKQSTGDLQRIREIIAECGDRISVFEGEDPLMYDSFVAGADGAVWGGANLTASHSVKLFELVAEKGDLAEGKELWDKMFPIFSFLGQIGFHAGLKAGLALRGIEVGSTRKPTPALGPEETAELGRLLRDNLDVEIAAN